MKDASMEVRVLWKGYWPRLGRVSSLGRRWASMWGFRCGVIVMVGLCGQG